MGIIKTKNKATRAQNSPTNKNLL